MGQKVLSLAERLRARLQKLGLTERKAKELAKGLAPTASRAKVTGTVTSKLEVRLLRLGLTERKAKELAKGLAPTVRAAIKKKATKAKITLDEVDDAFVNEIVAEGIDETEDADLDMVAPRVDGHRVRLDLPVVPMPGKKGIELLRVMDGLSSTRTYLVAAVKSDDGILAVRQFSADYYNVKFYPDMAYWDKTRLQLASMGATEPLKREWYERVHVTRDVLDQILRILAVEAKPKSRMKKLMDRFLTVSAAPLVKAFDYLHKRVMAA